MLLFENPGGQVVGCFPVPNLHRSLDHDRTVVELGVDEVTVQPESLTPWSHACCWACRPGNAGSSEGWMLRMRLR